MDIKTALDSIFSTEDKTYDAYPYQVRTAETLLSGKNVVLRAPTGAGKTEAALGPYLLARRQGRKDYPLRCIIASPMRTLAKDLFERVEAAAKRLNKAHNLNLKVKLHTGEDPADPLLEADIIITTYDQLLSNYLHVPYSQSRRSHNIGAGGVVASYIVLDEFHLFDPVRAFRTTLEMARALQGVTPFLFMTATLSEHLTQKLADAVGAEFITPTASELATMHSQQKTRHFRRVDALLTAEAVADAHERRSIAIANTVDRVQMLYADLQRLKREGHPKLKEAELVMLHSRYFPVHRNEHEVKLKELLGRESKKNVILVASQAIEVGIDISSERLHTELCPANALLQRAGRNARYGGECGVVSVYQLPEKDGKRDILPYKGQEDVIEATWQALAHLIGEIKPKQEADLIDRVHTAGDKANWESYEGSRTNTLYDKMMLAFGGELATRADLIRDIQNVSLLLVKENADLSTWAAVNRHERLSVSWVDFAALEENRTAKGPDYEGEWLVKVPYAIEPEQTKSETRQPTRLGWKVVSTPQELQGQPLVLINPKFVFYNRAEGFRWHAPEGGSLGVSDSDIPDAHEPRPTGEGGDYWYVYETYEEHIKRVLRAAKKHAQDVWHICPEVDKKFGLPDGTTALAIRAAIAAHDIGKLSEGWQKWSRSWQARQVAHYAGGLLWDGAESAQVAQKSATAQGKGDYSAHTDYHPKYDKERSKAHDKQVSRPPHAGESAAVFMEAFGEVLRQKLGTEQARSVVYGIAGAIARHHSAAARGEIDAWKLDTGAAAEAGRVFSLVAGADLNPSVLEKLQYSGIKAVLTPLRLTPNDALAWIIYTLASRALRLGDTRSFEDVRQPEKEADS